MKIYLFALFAGMFVANANGGGGGHKMGEMQK